jgi:fructose-1,6-bisphosphatase/inositol monophosphatase family enzyme
MDFTVSIAAIEKGYPVVGVIYAPAMNLAFTAIKGDKAKLNSVKIEVSNEDITRFANIAIGSYLNKQHQHSITKLLSRVKFRNLGSTALHLAYVSGGSMICSLSSRAKLWDIAAGILLVESAGGTVSDYYGKSITPIDVDNYQGESYSLVATNKITHCEVLNSLKEQ